MDRPPQRWEPDRSARDGATGSLAAQPPFLTMLGRGARNRCPICGEGAVFQGYLRIVPECSVCHAPLGRVRADDAPPYFTIFIVGHLLLPGVFWVEKTYEPPMWLHMVVWLPLFTLACMVLLRPIKGATVGLMLRLGFGRDEPEHQHGAPPAERIAGTAHRAPPPALPADAPRPLETPLESNDAPPGRGNG